MGKPGQSEKMQNFWLNVFSNSKVNGAEYREDRLPSHTGSWPTDTYLQRRLRAVRAAAADEPVIVAQNPTLVSAVSVGGRGSATTATPQHYEKTGGQRQPAKPRNGEGKGFGDRVGRYRRVAKLVCPA